MIQAILVFNNHGKPRLVRFYQRFVSAAQLRHVPSGHPRPLPSSPDGSRGHRAPTTAHRPPRALALCVTVTLLHLLPLGGE